VDRPGGGGGARAVAQAALRPPGAARAGADRDAFRAALALAEADERPERFRVEEDLARSDAGDFDADTTDEGDEEDEGEEDEENEEAREAEGESDEGESA